MVTYLPNRAFGILLVVLNAYAITSLAISPASGADAKQAGVKSVWAVLDFHNESSFGGPRLGRECAVALDAAIRSQKRIVSISPENIYGDQGAIKQLSLPEQLDVLDLMKLGQFLRADAVVTGDVLTIERSLDGKHIQVTIAVRVMDVATGELINGSLARGDASAKSADADNAATDEAIQCAARAAIAQMDAFQIPIATVLRYDGPDNVVIDKEIRRDGMRKQRALISYSYETVKNSATVASFTLIGTAL